MESYKNAILQAVSNLQNLSNISDVFSNMGLKPKNVAISKMLNNQPLWKFARATGPFIQIAAVSGAVAVILGAYNGHKHYSENEEKRKQVFNIASQYHFIHTLAIFGIPMCRKPHLAGLFMILGKILFCGPNYFYAITGCSKYNMLNPIGGICFILGWLSLLL
ncbi:PREDICTED: transmembrane protein 256-like [Ceratosolen solmsi marchali]|uniref:Transmembrane protein 256-like n=1 Tax=Ceratosolen solmsi marchali TaxID=326594 RepID=A0AAJ6YRI6_9HYME|nr:PREDICTED: transmembrane protein 256-like [Ceratosolen solmsi marchali]